MAPKGKKRASTATSDEPGAKRVADFLKQQGVSKSMHAAIREIVQHPLAELTDDCRNMLLAMLPWSLCIPQDERHEVQTGTVKMVQELVESIQAKMQKAIEVENAALGEQDEKKAEFQKSVQLAETNLAQATAAADERKGELAEVSAVLLKQKHALADAEAKQKKENAELNKTQAQKLELEKVLADNFQKLKDGDWQPGQEEGLFKPLKALIAKTGDLSLDESLVNSLPLSLMKRDRKGFDQVVVDKFGETLNEKIDELGKSIDAMVGPAAANTAAVEEARAALDKAGTEQQEVASKFGAAQESCAKASAKVEEAKRAVVAFEPEFAKATAARKEKEDQLESFNEYNVCMFQMLVDRVSKKKEEAEAQAPQADAEPVVAEGS